MGTYELFPKPGFGHNRDTGPQTLTLSFGEIFIGESSLVHRGRGVPPPSSVLRHMVASRSCDRLYKHLLANWPAGKHLTVEKVVFAGWSGYNNVRTRSNALSRSQMSLKHRLQPNYFV